MAIRLFVIPTLGAAHAHVLASAGDAGRRWLLTPVEEVMRALDDLVRAGKIRHIGLSDVPAWYAARGNPPPKNPVAPRTSWPEALAWAAVSGMAGAGARIVASAGAAKTYQSLTGKLPPGLESGGPTP